MSRKTLIVSFLLILSIIVWIIPPTAAVEKLENSSQVFQLDIEIISLSFSEITPIEGEEIIIYIEILNNGSFSVNNLTIMVYVDGEQIDNISSIDIMNKTSVIVESIWLSEGGTHIISAIARIEGIPLTNEPYSEEITVTIGDVFSLIIALLVIGVTILGISIVPSITNRPKKKF